MSSGWSVETKNWENSYDEVQNLENNSWITPENIYGAENINLWNPDEQVFPNIIDNYCIHDGILLSNDSYFVSSKIKIKEGNSYAVSPVWVYAGEDYRGAIFDKYDNFLKNVNGDFIAPSNSDYLRLTVYKARNWKNAMIILGDSLPDNYINPGCNIPWINLNASQLLIAGNRWFGKKGNFIGDSITADYGSVTQEQTYPSVVGKLLGLSTVRNYGIPGSTIGVPSDGDHNPMVIRYTQMEDDADIITFMGGSNDIAYVPLGVIDDNINTTYYGALKILCDGLISKYPSKLIIGITPPRRLGVNLDTFQNYVDAFIEVCKMFSIPCLNLFYAGGIYPSNQDQYNEIIPDGLHPNAKGREIIAYKLAGMIRSN